MGIKRIVDTSFWTDGKVDDFSPEDKYFMLYLLTNPFSTQLGIYEISIKQVSFQMGYSVDAVKVLIERFESKYKMILFSPETNEIAIKNFLRHSIIKGGAPVRDCLIKEIKKVKNRDLIARVFAHIKDSESLNETVKKIIAEYEEKNGALLYTNEKENENENDNDNEVSYPDTGNESFNDSSEQPATKPKQKKTVKHKHGEFQNVLLTDSEFEKLAVDFGVDLRGKAISFLDSYIEEKGYKSKSHNLAIRRWVVDAVKENESKPKRYGRKEPVPGWAQPSLGSAELEAIQEALKNDPVTVGNSPELAERAEILRQKIQGG